jgi:putative variant cofactor biosynthesis B12-binding/radical SAM domain protein 1
MRVLLLLSYNGPGKPQQAVFPIGLSYIAALLKEDHELFSLDLNLSEDPEKELRDVLDKFDPDVVGVSFRNVDAVQSYIKRSYYPPFVSMIRTIRKIAPSCKLVVGGAGFSIFSKEIMERNPEIDFGVQSEGEYAFFELLRNLDHPERVNGILLRKNGKVVFTEEGEPVDFDLLPPPCRDVFDLDKYRSSPSSIGVQSKRGCRFGCIYCLHSFFMGSDYRLRRPIKVIDEIEDLVTKYGINSFYFVDSVFNAPLDHAREICREIIRRKLDVSWEACFRPDFVNAKFMEEATAAGCRLFDFSPDGASNDAMQVLGKNLKVEHIERTIDLVRRMGDAQVAYEFMYDLPCCNTEQVLGLARLLPKIMLGCREKLRSLSLTRMRVYPHTRVYEIALEQGKIRPETDLLYPVYYESGASKLLTDVLPHAMRASAFLFQKFTGAGE